MLTKIDSEYYDIVIIGRGVAGKSAAGRRLLEATGVVDELPDVDGLRERWGLDVFDHQGVRGGEFTGRAVGILGSGPVTVQTALSFRHWSERVTLFLHTAPEPTDLEWEQLAAKGVCVVVGVVRSLVIEDDMLVGVLLADGHIIPLEILVVTPVMTAQLATLAGLGLTATPHSVVGGTLIESADLLIEDVESARLGRKAPFSAQSEAKNTQRVLGDRRHGLDTTKF